MLNPLTDHVVLTLEKEERTTKSGIIITSEEKDKPAIGKVLSIGVDVVGLKAGDRVIYQTYSGSKVTLENVEYLVIQAKNILATITD